MTKKHFKALAAALARQKSWMSTLAAFERQCFDIADVCAASNPAFGYKRFLDACGVYGQEKGTSEYREWRTGQ